MSKDMELAAEYDARLAEWQSQQSGLIRAINKLESSTAKLEEQRNNVLYDRLNPFSGCGKFDLQYMEETFGYAPQTMHIRTEEDLNEFNKRLKETDRSTNPEDEDDIHPQAC
ncbi:MAG: hypothetical protein WA766_03105 [Candidatus Acidiferrales bacterium]